MIEFSKTPFTSYFRLVMKPGEEKEEVFVLQHVSLKEGGNAADQLKEH